ncbi:MAG: reverse transcriptase N-terminal domain-containing protein, partial [Nostoc desertorum CM1-VF14]|nr:reverse transcriptase N-terminal domain-containing protein [Nostoc desertorum CM1-VF14]
MEQAQTLQNAHEYLHQQLSRHFLGKLKKVRSLQKLMLCSYSNRLISVRKVTQRNYLAGRAEALLPPSPLRTGLTSFQVSGSSKSLWLCCSKMDLLMA